MRHIVNTVTLDGTYAIPILGTTMDSIEEKDGINPEDSAVNSQSPARRTALPGLHNTLRIVRELQWQVLAYG
jgi:hypothetical protein